MRDAIAAPPERELFVHDDPTVVADWCRERAVSGSLLVAPSSSARRHTLRRATAPDGVTLGVTVASRGRLLDHLETRAGLPSVVMMSPALERLLIEEAARAAGVPLFDDELGAPAGAVNAVATLIRTLRMNRLAAHDYREAGGDERAARALERFEARRTALSFHDRADRIARLIDAGLPALALVIEDPAFPDRATFDLHAATIAAATSVHVGAPDLAPDGDTPPAIAALESLGFSPRRETGTFPGIAMRAIGGVGAHDEIELVAREILALLRRESLRPAEILGVAPNAAYLTMLHESCARIGIPVASPRRVDALDVPLVRALLGAFRMLADEEEDTPENGLALLATPYVGLGLARHDRLSRSLVRRGLGAMRSWRSFADGETSRVFRALAAGVPSLAASLQGERAPRALAATLSALALDHGFLSSGRRAHLGAGRDEALRLDQQGWNALTECVAELGDALHRTGITWIGARRWLAELTDALAGRSVRAEPRGVDGVRLTIAGAGLPRAAHVFAVGWREGLVPRRLREDPLLPERVKRALVERTGAMIPLAPDRIAREHERRERIRRAATRSLTISWPAVGEDGDQLLPSFYLDDLGIADRAARSVGDVTWPLALAASREERTARAIYLAKHRPLASLGDEGEPTRQALRSLRGRERRAYGGRLHAAQSIALPAEVIAELTPLAATSSATQAGMAAHCLYEHFARRRLGIQALAAPAIDGRILGTVAHAVLAEVGRCGFDPTAIDGILDRTWTEQVPRALREDVQSEFDLEMLREQLHALVDGERDHLAASGARPAHFELAFGEVRDGSDPASRAEGFTLMLPEGSPIPSTVLRGSIDRVDLIERDGRRHGIAIDYKSGKGESYRQEMEEMADFQLPIYCALLPTFGIEPVGAFYLGIASGERHGVVREEFAELLGVAKGSAVKRLPSAAFDAYMGERMDALRTQVARLARGELAVRPRKDDCRYCDLRPVCRVGTFAVTAGGGGGDA